jgi:hypothetical protein
MSDDNINSSEIELKSLEHDWYDPEVIWHSTYSDSIRISNYALRFVCKNCLIEVVGVTGSPTLIEKLNAKDCIE